MNKINTPTLFISLITSRRDKINKIAALKPLSKCKNHFHSFARCVKRSQDERSRCWNNRFEELLQMLL